MPGRKTKIEYEADLNPQQMEVVLAPPGPALVIAGAGSGKTRTITFRVAHLVASGEDPSRILLATFTNKAAREMLHRVEQLISLDIRRIWGGTFHHVGNLILRRHAGLLGYTPSYTILDREDSRDLIDTCLTDLGISKKGRRFPKSQVLQDIVSHSANTEGPLERGILERYPFFVEFTDDILSIARRYGEKKRRSNLMDFDDLLLNWKLLFQEQGAVKTILASRFRHILVDEYQDTNKIQAELIDQLAEGHRNLVVVGDDAQSIYAFRGAHFANIIEFPRRYPDAKLFKLEINYRSSPEILSLANSSIRHNHRQFPKLLQASRDRGALPVVLPFRDVQQQADVVAQAVLALRDEGVPLEEIAILYRSHYHSMEVQLELTRRAIPYVIRSGLRFFEQAHIKDVVSHLKVLANPRDEIAWIRILRLLPRIGRITAERLNRHLSDQPDPLVQLASTDTRKLIPKGALAGWADFGRLMKRLSGSDLEKNPSGQISLILEGGYLDYLESAYPDYRDRSEEIRQLAVFAGRFCSVEAFLSELALVGSIQSETVLSAPLDQEGSLVLSTIHQAKGLEWRAVFLIWLAEGRFPPSRALASAETEEEERRLFYVGVTRAKDFLTLSYPIVSEGWAGLTLHKPSRFLRELDSSTYARKVLSSDIDSLAQQAEYQ